MNKALLAALSLLCFTPTSFTSLKANESQMHAYEGAAIQQITIDIQNLPEGAPFNPKPLLQRLDTKKGTPFSQAVFDKDLKKLAQEFDRIEPTVELTDGKVRISILVWAKPQIRSIEWEGNQAIKTRALQKELGIEAFKPFNRYAFNQALNKIKELYIKKGYFETEVRYQTDLDPKTNEIALVIVINEGRSGKIEAIDLCGFSKEEESQILKMILTKKHNLFSFLKGTGIYNEEMLEHDRMVLVDYLQNQGYADSQVGIEIKNSEKSDKVRIIITADKGEIYHFGRVTFEGNYTFSNEKIEAVFLARPEGIYSPEKLHSTVTAIKDLYGREGHIETNVHFETCLNPDEPLYNVHFTIEEGAKFKIGMIHLIGNCTTQDRVILRESLLIPGDTFDLAKLQATEMRLLNMGYFKAVNVYAVRTPDDESLGPNYRDVYIEVEETTTGNISLFFGASSTDNVFGGIDIAETNFNIRGLGCLFSNGLKSLRGGGEYAHIKVTIGKKQTNYSFSWMDPYFNDTLWRVGFDINKTHSTLISSDYDIDSLGGTLYMSYPLTSFLSYGVKYRLRNSDLHISDSAGIGAKEKSGKSGILSALGTSLSYDSTDQPIKPHQGYRGYHEVEYAGLGGIFDFLKLSTLNTLYTPIWSKGTMKYRADFTFIEPLGKTNHPFEIPLNERFFQGGDTSVRGYAPYSLGPRLKARKHKDSSSDADKDHKRNKWGEVTGGITSSVLSLEYLQEVNGLLDLFVFADAGAVSMERFKIRKYQMSVGGGIRLQVANKVPIIVGYGYPINPGIAETQKLFFSMGGQF